MGSRLGAKTECKWEITKANVITLCLNYNKKWQCGDFSKQDSDWEQLRTLMPLQQNLCLLMGLCSPDGIILLLPCPDSGVI